jgi:hypothetical protein
MPRLASAIDRGELGSPSLPRLTVQIRGGTNAKVTAHDQPARPLNKFIGAIIAYGPKNKTKKARMARKAARRKKLAAMKRD